MARTDVIDSLIGSVRAELANRLRDGAPTGALGRTLSDLEAEAARRARFDAEMEDTVERALASVTGTTRIGVSLLGRPHPKDVDIRAGLPRSTRDATPAEAKRGVAIAYVAKRFSLYRAIVERLEAGEKLRMETQYGAYELSRQDIETTFPRIVASASYRTGTASAPGACRYFQDPPPAGADRFLRA